MNEEKIEQGRLRYIRLSGSFYIKLMTNRMIGDNIVNPLPNDARFIRSGHDDMGTVFLVFESDSFEMVHEGEEIPFHGDIIFKRNPLVRSVPS